MISLKIETLLEGKVVEKNRVEYKEGWNPSDITHSICASANDYANVNGGYIVIGVKEDNGVPILPPKGILKEQLDGIQKEIFQYCNLIEPRYIPQIEVVNYPDKGTHLLYLKCSAGDAGPYRAPKDVYSKKTGEKPDKTMCYWIRPTSLTTIAKQGEIGELFEKFNAIPFDDRVNRRANIDIIRRGYLEDFLRDSNSSLSTEINNRNMDDLLLALEVANETDTNLELRNIAILMFAERPDKLISGAQINLVRFNTKEAEAGNIMFEKTFTGPIWKQVTDVLDYIKTNVIIEKTVKIENQEKSVKCVNYPYNALEEAIVNAVFHKSYREDVPVEVRVYIDRIMIINFPGPDGYMDMEKFAAGKVRARKYRNRRIGEFFKEIDLSEKQGTGIPKILNALSRNGSPKPLFETDERRTYLETTIFIREGFDEGRKVSDKVSDKMSNKMSNKEKDRMNIIIMYLEEHYEISSGIAADLLDVETKTASRLLNKAEKCGIVRGEGKNKTKKYVLSTEDNF